MRAQQPDKNPDDLLEGAIASLRRRADAAVKRFPEPPPQTIRQTLERLAGQQMVNQPSFKWKSILLKPAFRFSVAAAIIVAMAAALWCVSSGSGSIAFGDVIAIVKDVRSVSYKLSGTINIPGRGPMAITSDVVIVEPSRMRQVTEPGGMIMIWDFAAGKMLTLSSDQKTATILNLTNQPKQAGATNIIEEFKHLDSSAFEPIPGEKTINNQIVVGFKPKGEAANRLMWQTFWVDKQTRLPVQIDVKIPGGVMAEGNMVMRDFKWNVPVDEASLSLTPPAGYTVQATSMDVTPATEKEFLDGLRSLAEMNHNAFPARLDFTVAVEIVTKHEMLLKVNNTTVDVKAFQERLLPVMTKVTRAIFFPANPASGSDFHYAGNGVALNQPSTPILWYLPKDAQAYRVIDADLTVHEVSASELPKVGSVLVGPPMGGPTTQSGPASAPAAGEREMPHKSGKL